MADQQTTALRVAMRTGAILLGATAGAAVAFVGTVLLVDALAGDSACLPDEGAGCGFAVAVGAIVAAALIGIPAGALSANAAARRLGQRLNSQPDGGHG